MATAVDANKATVLGILRTLCHHGLVARDPESKRFVLGPALPRLAERARGGDLRLLAAPTLRALRDRAGETTVLGVARGGRLVFLASEVGGAPFQLQDLRSPPAPELGWGGAQGLGRRLAIA